MSRGYGPIEILQMAEAIGDVSPGYDGSIWKIGNAGKCKYKKIQSVKHTVFS